MIPIKRLNETKDEYIIRASKKLYSQGFTIKEVSTMINADIIKVYNAVIENKLFCITEEEQRKKYIDLYEDGYSYNEISNIMHKSKRCIEDRIKSEAKYVRNIGKEISAADLQNIKKLYINGYTLAFIGRKYKISSKAIKYRLQRCGIWEPNHCNKIPLSSSDRRKVKSLLKDGYTLYDISYEIGRPFSVICKYK